MMRLLASSLFRWLTVAVCGSNYSRPVEVEFPAAGSLFGTFRGRRAAGCASVDALRPFNNSVNIEDKHEISFIRETLAQSFARRVPTEGRSSAFSKRAGESAQENILAESRGIFWQWPNRKETGARVAQWFAPAPAAAGAQA
jgi:hypothetical protein